MKYLKLLSFSTFFVLCSQSHAFNLSCTFGSKCIETQDTSIPSSQVITMMEECDNFTRGGIGRSVLKMSLNEIIEKSGRNITHPIYAAYYSFEELRDSPLKFKRTRNVEDIDYNEISQACRQLSIDFEKWVRN